MECGMRLERMPAQDMLDVLHYLFESDSIGTEEEQDAKSKLRGILYTQLYDRAYTWSAGSKNRNADGRDFGTQEVGAGPDRPQLTHKPYIPPTPVNANSSMPYGSVLDAPLG